MCFFNWNVYSFLVGGDGKIYEGAGLYKVGAHTRGYNTKSIGLAFIGDFSSKSFSFFFWFIDTIITLFLLSEDRPEKVQLEAAKEFLKCAVQIGALSENYKLFGAKQVSATLSPGRFISYEIKKWSHYTDTPLIS